jgi:hypothetical protein
MHEPGMAYILVRAQVMMIVVLAYQFYLAIGAETIDGALKDVEDWQLLRFRFEHRPIRLGAWNLLALSAVNSGKTSASCKRQMITAQRIY